MIHALSKDVRYGIRMLARAPAFAAVVIVTLALGIGANTAIFSVVNGLLLKPLPYPSAEQLVMVWQDLRARGGPATEGATPGNFVDWQAGPFAGVAAVQGWGPSLTGEGDPEPLVGEQVTHEYLSVLGVAPASGRDFRLEDDVPNAPRVVLLGHGLWQRRFGADPAVVGRTIVLAGELHEVIGVMPPVFRPAVVTGAEIWRPRRLNLSNPPRGAVVLRVVARLSPGLPLARAVAATTVLATQLEAAHPETNVGAGINLVTLHEQATGDVRSGLLVLLGAVAFVLLIACANVANLVLARASGRTREMAIRSALGATRRRILLQVLTESLLLAALGGCLGLLIGSWAVDALLAIAPQGLPAIGGLDLDRRVLAFTSALTLFTGLLFGIVPAWQASRGDGTSALKVVGRSTSPLSSQRARRALIVVEVAVALVLLVGGGLLMRTLLKLQSADLGFDPSNVLAGYLSPPFGKYPTPAQRTGFYDAVLARAAALPGVRAASLSSVIPLGGDSDMSILFEGRPVPRNEAEQQAVWYRLISPEYFSVMGIPLREGRNFVAGDRAPSIIVGEASARRFWPGESPIGRRVRFDVDASAPWFTVVGVAGDVLVRGARGTSRNEIYVPYWQMPEPGINAVLKTHGPPALLASALRSAVRDVDPDLAVSGLAPLQETVAESVEQPRFLARVVGIFGLVALALAVVGIYGVMAYVASQRRVEIGVRMALGADRRHVVGLIVGEGLRTAALGVVLGLAGALAMSLGLRALLFGVQPVDPMTFVGTTAILLAAAAAACLLPAQRAAAVDPMAGLRE